MADVQHVALTGSDLHEPKGVAAANEFEIYVADGAGSGGWENTISLIELTLDTSEPVDRSFAGATPWSDLILTYDSEHGLNFSWNGTSNELTYTGASDILFQWVFSASLKRTDAGSLTEMTVALFLDDGGGFTQLEASRVARSFSAGQVGSFSMSSFHTLSNGDKVKVRVMTDGGMDATVRNINWTCLSIGRIA